jgi:hypothetical protein
MLMLGLDGVCVTSIKDGKRKFVKDTNLEKEKKVGDRSRLVRGFILSPEFRPVLASWREKHNDIIIVYYDRKTGTPIPSGTACVRAWTRPAIHKCSMWYIIGWVSFPPLSLGVA